MHHSPDSILYVHALFLVVLDGVDVFGCSGVEKFLEVAHNEPANALQSADIDEDFRKDAGFGMH